MTTWTGTLRAGNAEAAGDGKAYSALEHAWDEGFGYFGANRLYGGMTAADIKAEELVRRERRRHGRPEDGVRLGRIHERRQA